MQAFFLRTLAIIILVAGTTTPVGAEPQHAKLGVAAGLPAFYAFELDLPLGPLPGSFQAALGTPVVGGFPYRSIALVKVAPEVVPGHRLGVVLGNIDQVSQQFQVIGPSWQVQTKHWWFKATPTIPIQWLANGRPESLVYWMFFPAIPPIEIGTNVHPNLELSLRLSFAPLKAAFTF